ncbi:MAG: pyrroline-5-carboxylate reductase [Sedimentisphaerales bacterium]|nr:pyrroline-5-carboxylate reductase [Sedimentisphaerales bacterium]
MKKSCLKIGFLGSGKMAEALIAAIIQGKKAQSQDIMCSDVVEERVKLMESRWKVQITSDNQEVIKFSDIIFLSFKPQNFPEALEGMGDLVRPDQVIVSIMAGVRIERIRRILPGKVIRVMPNTACLVNDMAGALAGGDDVAPEEMEMVIGLLECAGVVVTVREEELDAVTGLSGSGPAFVAYLIESFIAAGVEEGLDQDVARNLTLKTFAGTARLLSQWNMAPEDLIKMVSSPNGTTVAGRKILESSDVSEIIKKTVRRAAERSRELG